MSRVLGIDEAGRGCVLGALYVGGFVVELEDPDALRAAGAADSKTLTPKRRLEARKRLEALGTHDVVPIHATEIDEASLNALEEAAILTLIRRYRPALVRMDALGPPKGVGKLIARFEGQLRPDERPQAWVIEPKADGTYPVVGAASIFAKTTRDDALAALADEHGALGSGYPHDPVTRKWLREHADTGRPWPYFVRKKWSTITDLAQGGLFGAAPAPTGDVLGA